MRILAIHFLFIVMGGLVYSQDDEVIYFWPGEIPGETEIKAPPVVLIPKRGDTTRLSKVSNPSLTVYKASPKTRNGAAVIICPGGGYRNLVIDMEGSEIAEWLRELGYTAFVLQYRVPENRAGALQDAQRAIRYVRGMSEKWGVEADKIGMIGFSAGGSLSARASTLYRQVHYEPIDKLDLVSARPDFSILIYPAYLDEGVNHALSPELRVDKKTPPMFLFVAADDRHANSSLVIGSALREASVPFELHILPLGGHGFGMRSGNRAAETWPAFCEKWMQLTIFE
jgi:acetyl esterase/lipase